MAIARHSHCFSKSQLQIIIDSYLNMAPYYSALLQVLKNYTRSYQQQLDMHKTDSLHPIRIYTKDSSCNKNTLEEQKQNINANRKELHSTYTSTALKHYYLYPLECVVQMLQSEQFYSFLPQNIIINGLFTQTNLKIIIQALIIVSEDMSKRIRSTISGKQLEKVEEEDKIIEKDFQQGITDHQKTQNAQSVEFMSIVNIEVQDQDEIVLLKPPPLLRDESKLVRTNIMGTQRQITIDRDVAESDCRFCQDYLIYLYETVGQNPSDEDINRISMQSVRCLRLIAKAVTHFTMYLTSTAQTQIENDIHTINKILNTMGLVITEDIYSSELNPKNKQPNPLVKKLPQNLIEDLQPYFSKPQSKESEKYYSIEQLFKMIIYCPTTQEVKEQLKHYKIDHFQKDPVLKSYEKEEIVKKLLRKECQDMKQFQKERVIIAENTVNLKPIYKQLQFEEEQLPSQNIQPNPYNAYTPIRHNTIKPSVNQKNHSIPFSLNVNSPKFQSKRSTSSKKQHKNFMAQISSCISKVYQQPKLHKKGKRQNHKKQNYKQLKTVDESVENNNLSTISKVFKRNMLKGSSNVPKLLTSSTQFLEILPEKNYSDAKEVNTQGQENNLTDIQFRRILMNAYNRSQALQRGENTISLQSHNNASVNNYLTGSVIKMGSKKNNGYSTTLSNFIGRKQEQEQIECIEKQEKELYNKQQLNGFHIKSQIQQEIRLGKAVVFDDYRGIRIAAKQCEILEFYPRMNKQDTKYSQNTTARNKLKQARNKQNVILETSTKYNQTGLIRNEKYNKSIKSQLINHRQSFLIANQKQNEAKSRLAQIYLKKKQTETEIVSDIKKMYENELQIVKQQKHRENGLLFGNMVQIQQFF